MLETFQQLRATHPHLDWLIPIASTLEEAWLRNQAPPESLKGWSSFKNKHQKSCAPQMQRLSALEPSTLQTALLATPMVIVYRVSWLTFAILRRLVKVAHIGLVNLIAGRRLVPEFIQDECSPSKIVDAVSPLLEKSPEREAMLQGFKELKQTLGEPGVSERVTDILFQECARLPAATEDQHFAAGYRIMTALRRILPFLKKEKTALILAASRWQCMPLQQPSMHIYRALH